MSTPKCTLCGGDMKKAKVTKFTQGCGWGVVFLIVLVVEIMLGGMFLFIPTGLCLLVMLGTAMGGGEKVWKCMACNATHPRA